ncbi:hypothetical protein HO173_012263 [Letharia columbiana]|uniref:Uncharacterized protein n=1 Tax=Letharia columbiana TaxID=112416 RepID=A0A8H6FGZ5_9LECA|nr:uncharacterized protein HO173_012263 [Letharia columbiana]KAF6227523.1 hypothetical protein HO173_012263 [Letharia columbiana]
MGVTGGGLDSEEEITAGTPMMDKWKAAQEVCPEFYRLKIMLGERMNVSTHTINNSGQSIDLTSVLPGSSRRAARSASDNEVTTHSDAAAEEEDEDAEGDDDNDDIVETTEDGVPTIAVTEASPRKNKGKEKVSRSSSPSTRSQSISPSRKRGPSEFEHLLDIVEQGESRKRRRDIGIEQTKRLESQEETRRQAGKDSLELQRLKLEMAERQAVREHEMTMAKLRIYGVEAVAMPLESSMKKMNINVNAMESPGTLNAAGDAIGPVNGALEDISSIDYQEWMEQEDKVI